MDEAPSERTSGPDPAESIFLAWLAGREHGEALSLEALCGEHPELAPRFALLHAAHEQAEAVLGRLVRPVDGDGEALPRELAWADVAAPPRYELKGEIARGGMGTIFEVYDPSLRRTVAMKVLRRDRLASTPAGEADLARRQSRLLSEAQILAQLDHPGVVAIHEMGLDERRRAYFTMKRVRGQDFGDVIRAHHSGHAEWKLARLVGVLVRVCEAVAYAHQKGVLHRDLKPSNVLVGRFGEVFVMDWGLAKALGHTDAPPVPLVHATVGPDPPSGERNATSDAADSALSLSLVQTDRDLDSSSASSSPLATLAGEVVGTPPYMPPEQARGEIETLDARADVYAVGAMLYHVLSGKHPYADRGGKSGAELLQCVIAGPPTPLERRARTPDELVAISEKAMARDLARRYPTMLALADDLRAWQEDRVVRAHKTGAFAEARKWVRRNPWAAATIALVGAGLLAGLLAQALVGRELATRAQTISERAEALRRRDYVNRIALAAGAWSDGKTERMAALLAEVPADLRGWEWRFLSAQRDTSDVVVPLPGRDNAVPAATPDGRFLFTQSRDDAESMARVRMWDTATWQVARELGSVDNHWQGELRVSPDGSLLALPPLSSRIPVFDLANRARLPIVFTRVPESYSGICFSPDGSLLASFGPGAIELIGVPCMEHAGWLPSPLPRVRASFSPDGKRLFGTSWDGRLAMWDVPGHKHVATVDLYPTRLVLGSDPSLAVSPDGKWVATGGLDRWLKVFRAEDLEIVYSQHLRNNPVVAWSSDSALLAAGDGPLVRLFAAGTWIDRARLSGHRKPVRWIHFPAGGGKVWTFADDDALRVWDLTRPDRFETIGGRFPNVPALRLSRDGRTLAAHDRHDGSYVFFDAMSRRHLWTYRPPDGGGPFDLSPDGTWMVCIDRRGTLRTVDVGSARVLATLPGEFADMESTSHDAVRFSPDGSRIAVVEGDGHLSMWSAVTLQEVWRVWGHRGDFRWPFRLGGAAWSPDGTRLCTVSSNARAQIWDAGSGERIREWDVQANARQRSIFLADGEHVVLSGALNPGIACWTVDGRRVWDHPDETAVTLARSHDGSRLFSVGANGDVDVRDPRTGELIASFALDPQLHYGMCVSQVDDRLVTCSGTGLKIWDTQPWWDRASPAGEER